MIDAPRELVIIGSGELATVAGDAARVAGLRVSSLPLEAADVPTRAERAAPSSLGDELTQADFTPFFVAIDDNATRRRSMRRLVELGGTAANLVHPFAAVGHNVRLGDGVMIAAGTTVDPEVTLGDGVIVCGRVLICHETRIGAFCRIEAGAVIGGCCEIGEDCVIGSGAVVLSNVRIGHGATIGPRTVVNKSIPDEVAVAGVPARVKRPSRQH
jgi:sugar O-acyltransferase (sialic acid O-acetyltransferase NeuD family)